MRSKPLFSTLQRNHKETEEVEETREDIVSSVPLEAKERKKIITETDHRICMNIFVIRLCILYFGMSRAERMWPGYWYAVKTQIWPIVHVKGRENLAGHRYAVKTQNLTSRCYQVKEDPGG